jgi:hypothetical protein
MTPDTTPRRDDAARVDRERADGRALPAEVQYLIIVLALFGLLLVSGVPGREVPEVRDGTGVLRKGWAEQWSARVAAEQHDPGPAAVEPGDADGKTAEPEQR